MKCQKCDKPATFHITELTGGKPQELHLCEEHAREYLTQAEAEPSGGAEPGRRAGPAAGRRPDGRGAGPARSSGRARCAASRSYEFRNQGRLGCPHDYVCFEKELEPLIVNIHGETEHVGQAAASGRPATRDRQTELIRLRREMKEAINERRLRAGLAAARRDPPHRGGERMTAAERVRVSNLDGRLPWNSTN